MAGLGWWAGIRPGWGSNITICYADEIQNNRNKSGDGESRSRTWQQKWKEEFGSIFHFPLLRLRGGGLVCSASPPRDDFTTAAAAWSPPLLWPQQVGTGRREEETEAAFAGHSGFMCTLGWSLSMPGPSKSVSCAKGVKDLRSFVWMFFKCGVAAEMDLRLLRGRPTPFHRSLWAMTITGKLICAPFGGGTAINPTILLSSIFSTSDDDKQDLQ